MYIRSDRMFFSLKMNVVRFINWTLVMSDFCKKTGNPFRNIYSSADHQTYKHDSKPFFFFFNVVSLSSME